MVKRLAARWASFEVEVVAPGASIVQRKEMRRAFYAGGESVLAICYDETGPDDEPTEEDLRVLDELVVELKEFVADIRAGRA